MKIVKIHRKFTFQIDIGKVRGWPYWAFWVPLGRPEGPGKDFKSHTSCPKKLFRKNVSFFQKGGGPPPGKSTLLLGPYSLPLMVKDFNIEIEIEEDQQSEIKVEDQISNQRSKLRIKWLNTRLMTPWRIKGSADIYIYFPISRQTQLQRRNNCISKL